MNRLKIKEVVEIPQNKPVITYKRLKSDMRSPYRHNLFEVGKVYHNPLFTFDNCKEGFFSFKGKESDVWDGEILVKIAIYGKIMLINDKNIESEYMKILSIQ